MKFRELLAEVPGVLALPDEDADITAPVTETAQHVQPGGVFLARPGRRPTGTTHRRGRPAGAAAVVGTRAPTRSRPVPYAQVADGCRTLVCWRRRTTATHRAV